MKSGIYKIFVCSMLLATFLTPNFAFIARAQNGSGLRYTPIEADKVEEKISIIINRSEAFFREGELELENKKYDKAREKFDKSVEVILLSGMNVRSNARLQKYYSELIEKVYRLEVPNVPTVNVPKPTTQLNAAGTNGGTDNKVIGDVAEVPDTVIPRIGFTDQTFEASPLDELSKLELIPEEIQKYDVATPQGQAEVAYITQAVKVNSFGFAFRVHPMVTQFVAYYQGRGRGTMVSGLEKSGQFTRMARRIFKEEGVPENMVWLGQVESAWKPWARSWAAASGLWQFIPGTGTRYGLRQNAYLDERHNYEKATRASARYLKFLADRYNGNWELAMAGYNSGEGNVDKAIRRAGVSDFWAAYPYLPRETRNYVPNILATILVANNPNRYGFGYVRPMPPIVYDRVRVPPATSISLVAQASNTSVDVIRYLNPDLRQGITPPNEPYIMLVPAGKSNEVVAILRRVTSGGRNTASVIKANNGEDWNAISLRTGIPVEQLQRMNSGVDPKKGGNIVIPANGVANTGMVRPSSRTINAPKTRTFLVKANQGDTVAIVATRYRASVDETAKLNGLLPDTILQAGREIKVIVPQ